MIRRFGTVTLTLAVAMLVALPAGAVTTHAQHAVAKPHGNHYCC